MVSILIPTYNYNVYPLVHEMYKQARKSGVDFEILVYDDASTQNVLPDLPADFNNVIYKIFPINIGRTAIRYELAKDAKFNKLLMMDADVFPKDRFFFTKMIREMEKTTADIYFGGINVPKQLTDIQQSLRWKYGKERESLPLSDRLLHPYISILCGTILVDKKLFLEQISMLKNIKRYGLDVYFTFLLKKNQRKVQHYNNPITHLGLETNAVFLQKTRKAMDTYHYLFVHGFLDEDYVKLVRIGEALKQKFFGKWLGKLFPVFAPLMQKNLFSKNPSLRVFDMYKLMYYCSLK